MNISEVIPFVPMVPLGFAIARGELKAGKPSPLIDVALTISMAIFVSLIFRSI